MKDREIIKSKKDLVVLSLVRGGAVVGYEIAKRLKCPHYPLVVKKIGAPYQEELAIGAVCDGEVFLHNNLIKRLNLSKEELQGQIEKAKQKEADYLKKFKIKKANLVGKVAIITDDGVATGASIFAAGKCMKAKKVKKVILAIPVAPSDFDPDDTSIFDGKEKCFDKVFILHRDPNFYAVGQFYREFDQISDSETMRYF